jgi:hypothetical protein
MIVLFCCIPIRIRTFVLLLVSISVVNCTSPQVDVSTCDYLVDVDDPRTTPLQPRYSTLPHWKVLRLHLSFIHSSSTFEPIFLIQAFSPIKPL